MYIHIILVFLLCIFSLILGILLERSFGMNIDFKELCPLCRGTGEVWRHLKPGIGTNHICERCCGSGMKDE